MTNNCEMCKAMGTKTKATFRAKKRYGDGVKTTMLVCEMHANLLNMGWVKLKL